MMMTEKEILQKKIEVFAEVELWDKLIEELLEALDISRDIVAYLRSGDAERRPELFWALLNHAAEELADVIITGPSTMQVKYKGFEAPFMGKLRHGIHVQLRQATEEREAMNAGIAGAGDA